MDGFVTLEPPAEMVGHHDPMLERPVILTGLGVSGDLDMDVAQLIRSAGAVGIPSQPSRPKRLGRPEIAGLLPSAEVHLAPPSSMR